MKSQNKYVYLNSCLFLSTTKEPTRKGRHGATQMSRSGQTGSKTGNCCNISPLAGLFWMLQSLRRGALPVYTHTDGTAARFRGRRVLMPNDRMIQRAKQVDESADLVRGRRPIVAIDRRKPCTLTQGMVPARSQTRSDRTGWAG